MIPKIIHYIWLGNSPLPRLAEKCIQSWKKYAPEYEIKEWNETNLDLDKYEFVKQALAEKDYAFASDVLRLDILYSYGGIYLDIDVELIKPIDKFLKHSSFVGLESGNLINPGAMYGTVKNNEDLKNILDIYKSKSYLINGKKDQTTICEVFTEYYKKLGFKPQNTLQTVGSLTIYPIEYFSPYNTITSKMQKTTNTHSIHHLNASWYTPKKKFLRLAKKFLNALTFGLFGKILNKKRKK